jgi:hypothetical protein
MTVSSQTSRVSYSGNGSTTAFSVPFYFLATSHLKVILRASDGTETTMVLNTDYTVSGAGVSAGGTVTMTSAPASSVTVVITRNVPLTQDVDYQPNDPFPAQTHEQALDKLTMEAQQLNEAVGRSIKLSTSNTMSSTEFTVGATDRANKVLSFDAAGELSVTQELGTYQGSWTSGKSYKQRDIVKDTSNANIYICLTAHTASGSQPISTNTDSAKWALLVDAATATSASSSASTSATNAANSASAASSSASSASTSASNASTSASNASTSATNAASSASSASSSASSASSSATAASASAAAAAASAASGLYRQVLDKSANYTVLVADQGTLFRANTGSGAITFTLPQISTVTDGFKVSIVKWTSDSNQVSITRSGSDTINGGTTVTIGSQYSQVILVADFETNTWFASQSGLGATNVNVDRFSGNASTTAFTLTAAPGAQNNADIFISGVYQQKNSYTISGTTLTFSAAPPTGTNNIEVVYSTPLPIGTPSDGTVTAAKMASGAAVGNLGYTPANKAGDTFTGAVTATSLADSTGDVRSIPQNAQTAAYTLVAGDNGKHISITTGGVTVPSGVFSAGQVVTIYNNSASNQTITQGSGLTLQWAGQTSSTTGNRTLGLYGMATVLFISSSVAVITGAGLT